jgi:hypothetical protein
MDHHSEYEQQDSKVVLASDKRFSVHCKQDAKDKTQLVGGNDAVFIRPADYYLVDSPCHFFQPENTALPCLNFLENL